MSILVMSDTHGLTGKVNQLVQKITSKKNFDHIIHCGDFCCDRKQEPFPRMIQVRGNCDTDDSVPEEQVVEWGNLRILVVHGHLLNVKRTAMNLRYRAMEKNANIILFGHSHVMTSTESGGRLFVNPGSLAQPRKYPYPSVAILDRLKEGQTKVQMKVSFYTPQLNMIKNQGGTFTLPLQP